jgi:hypothetical protein
MYWNWVYSFAIGLVGAILFLLVDKYEPYGPMARLLNFWCCSYLAWRFCTSCSHMASGCFRKRACRGGRPQSRHVPIQWP